MKQKRRQVGEKETLAEAAAAAAAVTMAVDTESPAVAQTTTRLLPLLVLRC